MHLRRSTPALHRGSLELLDAPEGVLRFRRHAAGAEHPTVEVAINFTDRPVAEAVAPGDVLGGTLVPGTTPLPTELGPDEARIVAIA
jgi:hypothetical protein